MGRRLIDIFCCWTLLILNASHCSCEVNSDIYLFRNWVDTLRQGDAKTCRRKKVNRDIIPIAIWFETLRHGNAQLARVRYRSCRTIVLAGTYRAWRWVTGWIQIDVDMHDMRMWHNERVIPHADCWVRDDLPSPTIDLTGHIELRGGERIKFRLACTYAIK